MGMKLICMDLEGVLIPEFWEEFSKATNIPELMKTTRDIPDYDALMQMRLKHLKENGYGIYEIKKIVKKMKPLDGAVEYMNWIRSNNDKVQPIVITGSYYDYIMPLIEMIGNPLTFANSLIVDSKGNVTGYTFREKDGKIEVVKRLQQSGYEIIAIGDSFNDVKMLKGANKGILFRPCEALRLQEPQLEVANNYSELKKIIEKHI